MRNVRVLTMLVAGMLVLWSGTVATYARSPPRDVTYLLWSPETGTQVIYLGRWGKTYLWHPSIAQVVPGVWSVREPGAGSVLAEVCLRFGGNDYDPVSGQSGARQCHSQMMFEMLAIERVAGDPFGLATSAAVPTTLRRSQTTFTDLARRAGVEITGVEDVRLPIIRPGEGLPSREVLCRGAKPEVLERCLNG